MASFEREKTFVGLLLERLRLNGALASNPNAAGQETGIDVAVYLADGRIIGVQVTEFDPYKEAGKARALEKTIAKVDPHKPYCMNRQNDPAVVLDALANSIKRKVDIASQHSFEQFDEAWLLVCAGILEHGAIASTSIMTPWLWVDHMNSATDDLLHGSKFSRCFLLPLLGVEQAFYQWDRKICWKKLVKLEDIRSVPREAYINSLLEAADAGDWQEVDRLCDEECKMVLFEMRQNRASR
ncbi:MAG TPA: hypothetical protein VEH75_03375 [Xanthobacteraceae bacterium]|nr:hypothetical protein [Xanthobacteraceae bacterium]